MKVQKDIRDAFADYAKSNPAEEVCAFAINATANGSQCMVAVENRAENKGNQMFIPAKVAAGVQRQGDILAIMHSHVQGNNARPSMIDLANCQATNVPWLIYSVALDEWHDQEPDGWETPYEDRPFVHGNMDCGTLLVDYYSREYDVEINDDFEWRDQKFWTRDNTPEEYVLALRENDFYEVPRETLKRGDIVMMQLLADVINHAAIYVGNNYILHHLQNRISRREVYGQRWRDSTKMVCRHYINMMPGDLHREIGGEDWEKWEPSEPSI